MSESLHKGMMEQLSDLRREVTALEHQLALERAAVEAERRRTTLLQVFLLLLILLLLWLFIIVCKLTKYVTSIYTLVVNLKIS